MIFEIFTNVKSCNEFHTSEDISFTIVLCNYKQSFEKKKKQYLPEMYSEALEYNFKEFVITQQRPLFY